MSVLAFQSGTETKQSTWPLYNTGREPNQSTWPLQQHNEEPIQSTSSNIQKLEPKVGENSLHIQVQQSVQNMNKPSEHFTDSGNICPCSSPSVNSVGHEHFGNQDKLPTHINRSSGQSMNSFDVHLTSEILTSVKKKIVCDEVSTDSEGETNSDFVTRKQEISNDSNEFPVSSDHPLSSYSQTSPLIMQNYIDNSSMSSATTSSSNPNPDMTLSECPASSFSSAFLGVAGQGKTQCSNHTAGVGRHVAVCPLDQEVSACDCSRPVAKSKPVSKPGNLLPPCRVCGDKASGFHYGANTCEACKGFFRRSLQKDKKEFKCHGDSSCEKQKGRRNNCPLCRYHRCISVGMSKQAIKTGRYTHEKRTQNIVEVKGLQGHLGPDMLESSFSKREPSHTPLTTKVLSVENRLLVDQIFAAHKLSFPLWHEVLDSGSHKIATKKYAEQFHLRKSGGMSGLKPEQCDHISNASGITEYGRKDTIPDITKHLELTIMAFVRYAKAVPGFIDLPLNDQASLVKSSRFEIWMIGVHKFSNLELQVVSGPRGKSFHMEDLSEVVDEGFVRSIFTFAQTMQDMNLTNEETALLECVALTFADRTELQEPEKVETIQLRLAQCLEELLGTNQRFARVINSLVQLRDLTEWNKRISESMVVEWPNMKHHPLLLEIMSV